MWSLRMLDRVEIAPTDSIIDVGGGSSPLAAALLARGRSDLTMLDVSIIGMQTAQQRLGAAADRVRWLLSDVPTWQPPRRYVVWHDRALFHFMISEQDREAYLQALERATDPERARNLGNLRAGRPIAMLRPPRHPLRCRRTRGRARRRWRLIEEGRESHTTPSGRIQPFTWAVFRRRQ